MDMRDPNSNAMLMMMRMTQHQVAIVTMSLMAAFVLSAAPAVAEHWPQRTVRLLLPISAGSGPDVAARLFAERLAERWNQPVVIENRPDGLIGTAAFASLRDNHVLLFWNSSAITLYPLLQEKLSYDSRRDIVPISVATENPFAIAASNQLRTDSLRALLDAARSRPGKLNYNGGGGELPYLFGGFLKGAGVDMVLVPYREQNLAIQDVAEGRLDASASLLTLVLPLAQAGKLKLLALTGKERSPLTPDVPTAIEAGFPGLAFEGLAGFFGPRDMPSDVKERVAADVRAVAADPIFANRLAAVGQVARGSTPAEFGARIEERRAMIAASVESLGNKPVR
jgi:tripartite-type tricarboxylate transporter receptor subunit TctC